MADIIDFEPEDDGPKRRFERSVETLACLRELRKYRGESGKELSYQVFEDLIGMDVQRGPGYTALSRARHIVQREDGMVWEAQDNKGLRLLAPSELSRGALKDIAGVRRRARRALARQTIALENTQALTPDERAMSCNASAMLRLQLSLTKVKAFSKVAAANTTGTDILPVGRTLELFRRRAS